VTTSSLPGGAVGSAYPSTTLQASGGVTPYTWALASGSSLPAGLILSAGGALSGTPAAGSGGPYSLTLVVTDSSNPQQTAQATLPLTITSTAGGGTALTLTTTSLPNATLNTAYSATLTASGGVTPYTFSLTSGSSLPHRNTHQGGKHIIFSPGGGFNDTDTAFANR
jgi:hypothetical protein